MEQEKTKLFEVPESAIGDSIVAKPNPYRLEDPSSLRDNSLG